MESLRKGSNVRNAWHTHAHSEICVEKHVSGVEFSQFFIPSPSHIHSLFLFIFPIRSQSLSLPFWLLFQLRIENHLPSHRHRLGWPEWRATINSSISSSSSRGIHRWRLVEPTGTASVSQRNRTTAEVTITPSGQSRCTNQATGVDSPVATTPTAAARATTATAFTTRRNGKATAIINNCSRIRCVSFSSKIPHRDAQRWCAATATALAREAVTRNSTVGSAKGGKGRTSNRKGRKTRTNRLYRVK